MNDSKCLVVDASYLPRSIITTERAFVIYFKGNAEVIEEYPTYFKTVATQRGEQGYPKPCIIRVYRNIKMEYQRTPLTRINIYKRDRFACVYCGETNKKSLTLDHVVPKSKGGKDTWDNLVTACTVCNSEKSDLTIEEWGRPHPNPRRPHHLMLMKSVKNPPKAWDAFLFS